MNDSDPFINILMNRSRLVLLREDHNCVHKRFITENLCSMLDVDGGINKLISKSKSILLYFFFNVPSAAKYL